MTRLLFNSRDTLPKQIGGKIRRAIKRGRYKVGDMIPSYRDLCLEYGVSILTVKKAIDELARGKLLHVQQGKGVFVARELGDEERSLHQIGLVLYCSRQLFFSSPYLQEIFQGIMLSAESLDADVRIFSIKSEEAVTPKSLLDGDVDGAILVGVVNDAYIQEFSQVGLPLVVADYWTDKAPADYVVCDNLTSARRVVEKLYALGHRRISYIGGWSTDTVAVKRGNPAPVVETSDVVERREGFKAAVLALGISSSCSREDFDASNPEQAISAITEKWKTREDRPTAFVAYDTSVARLLIESLARSGVKVPSGVSVAAVCGAQDALALNMTLLYNQADFIGMGREAVRLLNERMRSPKLTTPNLVRVQGVFIEGNSVAPAVG